MLADEVPDERALVWVVQLLLDELTDDGAQFRRGHSVGHLARLQGRLGGMASQKVMQSFGCMLSRRALVEAQLKGCI